MEVFYVERGKQLHQFNRFDCQVGVIFVFALTFLFDLKDANELVEKMRPQLPQGFRESLEVQSDQHDSSQEEEEEPLFDILLVLLFVNFYHFLHQLIKLVLEIIVFTAENQESNSLHCIALLGNDLIHVCKNATLEIPFLHLFFKDFIWLSIDEILHDLLPLLEVDHSLLEECIHVEKVYDLTPIWFDQISVDMVAVFNNRSKEGSHKLVHHLIELDWRSCYIYTFLNLIIILENLNSGRKDYLNRFVRSLIILGPNQIDQQLTQYLFQGDD